MGEEPDRRPSPRDVSVVLPVGFEAPHLARALESLVRLDPPPGEIVVVLDRRDVPAVLLPEGARVVARGRSDGPAAARNDGARASRGEVLLFLDADVTVPPDLVARFAGRFREREGVDAIIGSYDDDPADPGFLSQYRNLVHHFVHQTSRGEASTFWGACGAVRREAFFEVGGFDPRYRAPSIEDIELGYRLREAGYRIVLAPELQVRHWKRWTAPQMVKTDVLRRGVPWVRLALRRGFPDDLNVRLRDRVSVLLAAGLLPGVFFAPLPVVVGGGAVLLLLDAGLYRFMAARKGALFASAAVPWRLLFHLYSAVAVALAVALELTTSTSTGEGQEDPVTPLPPTEEELPGYREVRG